MTDRIEGPGTGSQTPNRGPRSIETTYLRASAYALVCVCLINAVYQGANPTVFVRSLAIAGLGAAFLLASLSPAVLRYLRRPVIATLWFLVVLVGIGVSLVG